MHVDDDLTVFAEKPANHREQKVGEKLHTYDDSTVYNTS
jgi:hypothetical protein